MKKRATDNVVKMSLTIIFNYYQYGCNEFVTTGTQTPGPMLQIDERA